MNEVKHEFRTEVQYWGGAWRPLDDGSVDLPARMARGEKLDGIRLRTVMRTVTTTSWTPICEPFEIREANGVLEAID